VTAIPLAVLEVHTRWEEEKVDRCVVFFAAGLVSVQDVYPNTCSFPGILLIFLGLLPPYIPLSKIPEAVGSWVLRWLFWFGLWCLRTCLAATEEEAAQPLSVSPEIVSSDARESVWDICIYSSGISPNYYSCRSVACMTLVFNVFLTVR